MFTGIIEELGTVVDLKGEGTSLCLKIEAERIFSTSDTEGGSNRPAAEISQNGLKIGDSIAVNGVCLTATVVRPPYFEVTAVEETLRKTTLGSLTVGGDNATANLRVNLERAATLETRLGGHLVQGHVDGTARLAEVRDADGSWEFTFELPPDRSRYVIPKGSIALNGISLTVAEVLRPESSVLSSRTENESSETNTQHSALSTQHLLRVAIIPHTYHHTNLQYLKVGDKVNVEFDIIAKMVERLVKPY